MVVKDKQLTDQAIYVYLPTVEMAQEWKFMAEKASISISKFVVEHVDNSIKQEEEGKKGYTSRAELLKQLKEKDEEIARLANDTDSDGDDLVLHSVSTTSNGIATNNSNGTITYVPNPNFNGMDNFTYTVNDGNVARNDTAKVTIAIQAVNDLPMPKEDSAITREDTAVTISVLVNDTDVDTGDILTVGGVGAALHGNAAISVNKTVVTYAPINNYNGADTFTYTVVDGHTGSNATAKVNLVVTPINDLPKAESV